MEAEKTYQNKVPRTIQQKRGGEGALEFVDNRQGGILQPKVGIVKNSKCVLIQKVETNLHVQNGPSCWLTVLESMAAIFPDLKLNTLRNILTMYASKAEIDKSKNEVNDKGYIKGLRVTKEKIDNALSKIKDAHNSSIYWKNGEKIKYDRLYRFLIKISPSVARIVDNLFTMKGYILYSDIEKIFNEASKKLNQILTEFKGKTWDEQVEIIANQVQTQFSKDNDYEDFEMTMTSTFSLPVWAGINKGIKGEQLPYENTDFTDKKPIIDTYNHAIQIIEYGIGSDKWIKYKDPNRGNIIYTVSWDQFKCFAGDSHIYLFSYNGKEKVPQLIQD